MRWYALLISLAIALAFGTSYLTLRYWLAPEPAPSQSTANLEVLRQEFVRAFSPIGTLDFSKSVSSRTRDEWKSQIDPSSLLPQTHRFDLQEVRALYRYSRTCAKKDRPARVSPSLAKALLWQQHRCEPSRHPLPRDFLAEPPLLHPSGASYAWLLLQFEIPEAEAPAWIRENTKYLHAGELAKVRDRFPALETEWTPEQKAVAGFDPASLRALAALSSPILTDTGLWLQSTDDKSRSSAYKVYRRSDWESFWKRTPFQAKPRIGIEDCFASEGNLCWKYDLNRIYRSVRWPLALALSVSVALLLGSIALLLHRLRKDRDLERKRRFALQTLTHELRTPISSLALSIETLRREFDALPQASQTAAMRIFDEIGRLRRLTEASRRYLSPHASNAVDSRLPSLRDFIEQVCERYPDAGIRIDAPDSPFIADPYWLELSLKNLVENALHHGKPPVEVSARIDASGLRIAVQDSGRCSFESLHEMTEPFAKSSSSSGLGLGLSITEEAIRSIRGRLEFHPTPKTAFVIHLPSASKEKT